MALKTFTINNGSANQALVTNGSGVLSFAAVGASAGQVIQVVTATDQTQRSTGSTSFVTGSNTLSVAITPSSASNKVLALVTGSMAKNTAGAQVWTTIFRAGTNIGEADFGINGMQADAGVENQYGAMGMAILDSPNTTSSTTYDVRFRVAGSGQALLNIQGSKSSITLLEVKG